MKIYVSPPRYVQGPGALDRAGAEIRAVARSALIIVDPGVRHLAERIAASAHEAELSVQFVTFSGEITDAEIARLAGLATGFEAVCGVGGGKCIDAAKGAAHAKGIPMISVPSAASNDAPTSQVYVVYDEQHRLTRVGRMAASPALVLVDSEVIAGAPASLLLAGIGDALVKSHEVALCRRSGGPNVVGGEPPLMPSLLADGCRDLLFRHARQALDDNRRGAVTPELEAVIEAAILWSGIAFESGGLSIVHSMTRGLSSVPAIANAPHGLQVAYALLVEMRLAGDAVEPMMEFHRAIGLPCSLRDMGLNNPDNGTLRLIAEQTLAAPHAGNVDFPLTAEMLIDAMRQQENAFQSSDVKHHMISDEEDASA